MSRTLLDKIRDSHRITSFAEGDDLLFIDLHLLHEINTPQAFDRLRNRGLTVRRPDLTLATVDHNTPTKSAASLNEDPLLARQINLLEKNCAEFSIPFRPLGATGQGITHVIAPEEGRVLPGSSLVCCDSHTTTHGAFAALAIGIGSSQVEQVLATQAVALPKFKSMLVTVEGALNKTVSSKDVALALISQIGTVGATGHVIEFQGSAIASLSMDARMTLCNMAVEAGASAGMIGVDDVTVNYLKQVLKRRGDAVTAETEAEWRQWVSDDNASFDKYVKIDATSVFERVTWGTNPAQSIGFDEQIPANESAIAVRAREYMDVKSGQSLSDISIEKAFIGSCTNGRIEDLRIAAHILENRKVHDNVHLVIVPGSSRVRDQAIREGLDKIFMDAGADFRHFAGCSLCVGLNEDRLGAGQRSISTNNRNFEGRQGPGARTHVASPAVVAASAVFGRIARPLELFAGETQ
ncbi:3-isopropylmalate dehydratase large subunit [Rhizobium sp.]|jgi:3-isopropylmalate/(R)-2-methylmalate dehydratase large subunit|uniref:3-isopropylmalate dehydratase large subunit n=1 Tax=Rhizobium sp. TaxID=391 RepID=UPI000E90DBC6|nr:3-isopropylmalate dehydratase large subunit [Rhizobium sp.]